MADFDETAWEGTRSGTCKIKDWKSHLCKSMSQTEKVYTQLVEQTLEHYGKIDILINNAGITRDATLIKMDPADFQRVLDVNLTGVFNCTQAVVHICLQNGAGKIINTSSVSGVYGNFGQTNYAATKAAVVGMTKTWAKEFGRKGINVNAVAPVYSHSHGQ